MKIEETKNEKFHKEFKIQIPFEEVNSKVEEKVAPSSVVLFFLYENKKNK